MRATKLVEVERSGAERGPRPRQLQYFVALLNCAEIRGRIFDFLR
jgi:hypothetical protein